MSQISSRLAPAMRRSLCLACRESQQQLPSALASTSRTFTSTARHPAKLLAMRMEKDDPRDMANLEEFKYNDIPWTGHLQLEKDRTRLHLLRLIEFQFPEIKKLQVPYQAPPKENIIKLRHVYDLGDPSHPGSRKAVISFTVPDLAQHKDGLKSEQAQHKFKLLAGPRWDPPTDEVKISCGRFPTFNMNAKWCSDVLNKMIAEANDQTDPMTDIALDTSHYKARLKKKGRSRATLKDVPEEWLAGLPGIKQE